MYRKFKEYKEAREEMMKEAEEGNHEDIHDFRQALMEALVECKSEGEGEGDGEGEGEGDQDYEQQHDIWEGEGEGDNGDEHENKYHYMLMAMANQLLEEKLERQELDAAMKFSMNQEN
jgi:hypothetical protein